MKSMSNSRPSDSIFAYLESSKSSKFLLNLNLEPKDKVICENSVKSITILKVMQNVLKVELSYSAVCDLSKRDLLIFGKTNTFSKFTKFRVLFRVHYEKTKNDFLPKTLENFIHLAVKMLPRTLEIIKYYYVTTKERYRKELVPRAPGIVFYEKDIKKYISLLKLEKKEKHFMENIFFTFGRNVAQKASNLMYKSDNMNKKNWEKIYLKKFKSFERQTEEFNFYSKLFVKNN